MYADSSIRAIAQTSGEDKSRQIIRRQLFTANFAAYPGYVMGRTGRVSAHSKFGRFLPRTERRKLARAFAVGEWRKRNGDNVASLVP